MNPQHAQFFRELRELMKRHKCSYIKLGKSQKKVAFMLFDGDCSLIPYECECFEQDTEEISYPMFLRIDAPQKDGTNE